jgi:hemerythrin-like domain-containing protein
MDMEVPSDDIGATGGAGVKTEGDVDAIEMLIKDHRRVDQLFKRYEEIGPGNEDERARLVDEISEELGVHAAIEEMAFYPAVRDLLAEGDQLIDEAEHEHQQMKDNLAELDELEPGLARFDATVATLISHVRHHVREEEGGIFPKLRSAIGGPQLMELGRRLKRAKEEESGEPILLVGEEEIVVSLFETSEPAPTTGPTRGSGGTNVRTAKRPTQKRTSRRPAKKATTKRSTAKRVGAKKSTSKRVTRKSGTRKSTVKRAAAKTSTRKSTRKSTGKSAKRATAKRASRAKSVSPKTGTRKSASRKSTGRKTTTRKSSSRARSSRTTSSRSR